MGNLHVMLSPDGHWDVRAAEDGEILAHHGSREEALTAARQIAREHDGAEVRIHAPEGDIGEREDVDQD